MTKVLFIAYYFPPIGGAGVQRSQKFVQYLPGEGFLPVVVAGPTSSEDRWSPRDKSLLISIPPAVPVHRVEGNVPSAGSAVRRRLEGWFNIQTPFSRWWIQGATEASAKAIDGCELIFATMSPFESGDVARSLSRRFGIPWVADLRDPWALDEMQVHRTFLHRELERLRMWRLLSTAKAIVMNTPESARALLEAFPDFKTKVVVSITNGFDRSDFDSPIPSRGDRKFRIVHSGYLHTNNGLRLRQNRLHRLLGGAEPGVDILTRSHAVLLDALDRWATQRPGVLGNVELVLAGATSTEDRTVVDGSKVAEMVRFTGYLAHQESVDLLRTADLLFLPMHNLPAGKRSRIVPGKTYEYMASGRPILAAVPDGDARDFLVRAKSAFVCRPDDAGAMVKILDQRFEDWTHGRQSVDYDKSCVDEFERRKLTRDLARTLASALKQDIRSTSEGSAA